MEDGTKAEVVMSPVSAVAMGGVRLKVDLMLLPVGEVLETTRAINAFNVRCGIYYVGQFFLSSLSELAQMRGVGRTCMKDLEDSLKRHKLEHVHGIEIPVYHALVRELRRLSQSATGVRKERLEHFREQLLRRNKVS